MSHVVRQVSTENKLILFFRTELLKITCSCECFTLNEVNVFVR